MGGKGGIRVKTGVTQDALVMKGNLRAVIDSLILTVLVNVQLQTNRFVMD